MGDSPQSYELKRKDTVSYFTASDEASAMKKQKLSGLKPIDPFCVPLLTDFYQLSMSYAYWKNKMHEKYAVFDLFFRKSPFEGEFTVFAGLEECVRFISDFHFTPSQIAFLRTVLPAQEEEYWTWLAGINCSKVKVYALKEGTVCFPRVPLLRVEGPLAIVQLLETPLLTMVNYPSLIATNAARIRLAVGPEKTLLEFGCRRAQGPNGAVSASRYSCMGGFDGTSNVLAGQLFRLTLKGTHAHSYVTSFSPEVKLPEQFIACATDPARKEDLLALSVKYRDECGFTSCNKGELLAFVAYALAFPAGFLCLVDTYDTLNSGIPNFLSVALALHECGYKAQGIRLDSGDLAYLSKEARALFRRTGERYGIDYFAAFTIVASNDLNEKTILSLFQQKHEIDVFGVGTHLVTCQAQPALGAVFKLVQIEDQPRIKLSEEVSKVSLPGKKLACRLYDKAGIPIFDVLHIEGRETPQAGKKFLVRHPFNQQKRAYVTPSRVEALHHVVWDGEVRMAMPTLPEIKAYALSQLQAMRTDHLRPLNPTPYKVSVTTELYDFIVELWMREQPVPEFK